MRLWSHGQTNYCQNGSRTPNVAVTSLFSDAGQFSTVLQEVNQDEVYALRPTDARERKARVKTSHLNQGVGDKAQHAEKMA